MPTPSGRGTGTELQTDLVSWGVECESRTGRSFPRAPVRMEPFKTNKQYIGDTAHTVISE